MNDNTMSPEQAQEFVENNLVLLSDQNLLSRCIDGRYQGDGLAMVAKPGADAGDVMLVLGASNILDKPLSNEKAVNLVVTAVGGASNFRFHSDANADPNTPGIGCGHLREAKKDPAAYGLTGEQMDQLFAKLPELMYQGAKQEVLTGEHKEQCVIPIKSSTYGLKPMVEIDEALRQAFVYNPEQHAAQLDKISKLMQEEYAANGIVAEDHEIRTALDQAFAKQMGETQSRLAGALPVYPVEVSDDRTVVIN